jgi:hypothetical protein
MLLSGERVAAALAPGERKMIAFGGVEGSTLSAVARVAKSSRAIPRLTLLSPSGEYVDLGSTNPNGSRTAKFSGVRLDETGVWRIGVDSPNGAGSALTLSAHADRVPLRFAWRGELADAAAEAGHSVPAAPGRSMSVVVAATDGSVFAPAVEVVSPSGAVVASSAAAKRRVRVVAPIEEAGRYMVRVAGGPGSFSAHASVRPAPRRAAAIGDVEAAPEIDSFTPAETENQSVVNVGLDGVGFTDSQFVSLDDGAQTLVAGQVYLTDGLHASAALDLAEVPPGTYSVRTTTPAGRRASAAGQITVTNRAPIVGLAYPADLPAGKSSKTRIGGAGFDTGAELFVRRSADGALLPFTIDARDGHSGISISAAPPALFTGACDVEVRDPDGSSMVLPGGIDFVGLQEPAWAVHEMPGGNPAIYWVVDAVYDANHGRVLVAVADIATRVRLLLFDPAAHAVADSVDITAAQFGGVTVGDCSLKWDAVTDTFAVCLTDWSQGVVFARIVPDTDIHAIAAQARLTAAGTTYGTGCEATANPDDGGFVIVWDSYEAATGTTINAKRWSTAGFDLDAQSFVFNDQYGAIGFPEVAWQAPGRFLYVWCGYTDDYSRYAVRGFVGDSRGEPLSAGGPLVLASSAGWDYVLLPELARNPGDGSMLLTFWYASGEVYRSSCVRLAPTSAFPGNVIDLDLRLPQLGAGVADVVWNEARHEYVVATKTYDDTVVLFRINPDGSGRPAPFPESYEATWVALYGGGTPGAFGMVRSVDEADDDSFHLDTPVMRTVASSLR